MYVTVEEMKKHLNVDYDEDDAYLQSLIDAAEAGVERFIQRPFAEVLAEDGSLPADLKHAVRLMAGGLYANREPAAFTQSAEVPYTLGFLLVPYRKLS